MSRPPRISGQQTPDARSSGGAGAVLDVRGLSCSIDAPAGVAQVLRDIDLHVEKGTAFGIVGESGSGKSMLLRSILGLVPRSATVLGDITLVGQDLGALTPDERRRFIGRHVGVVFQNPMTSLNPVVRIGRQVGEASRKHLGLSRRQARTMATELLTLVGIPDARDRIDDYPHQFSGGMRQRIMIAMALACEPELLIADEATTALDVTVQKDILDLLHRIQQERNMTMVLVSHDLGVVAGRTAQVGVMYAGRLVEKAPTPVLFEAHRHRYTEALLSAAPRIDQLPHARLPTIPGGPPSLYEPLPGCPFEPRCAWSVERCVESMPPAEEGAEPEHSYRCYAPAEHSPANLRPGNGVTS